MRKPLPLAGLAACAAWPARGARDIRLWHAMSGEQRSEFERLAARFNASQSEWRVVLVRQASHDQTLGTALAALEPPHIVQMDESGAADLLSRKGVVRPLWQVMAEAGGPPPGRKDGPGGGGGGGGGPRPPPGPPPH